ncbi:hypothetical protein LPC_1166 [Legionella pneumophila str. Corby]|nr:hypothetical protein LPC_1166 [Legionella pneumophila str. Corby]
MGVKVILNGSVCKEQLIKTKIDKNIWE